MKNSFLKQMTVFLLIFTGACAIINVDTTCSALAEREAFIGITLKKTSDDVVTASGFGRAFDIDTALIKQQLNQIKENGSNLGEYKDRLFSMFQ